jgi:hypothetical protein
MNTFPSTCKGLGGPVSCYKSSSCKNRWSHLTQTTGRGRSWRSRRAVVIVVIFLIPRGYEDMVQRPKSGPCWRSSRSKNRWPQIHLDCRQVCNANYYILELIMVPSISRALDRRKSCIILQDLSALYYWL